MHPVNSYYATVAVFLSSCGFAFAENSATGDYPTYRDGILTIPRVDTQDQAGNFLDAVFKYTVQGAWELLEFKTAGVYPLVKAPIEQVELIVTDSFPVQVFLKAQGAFTSGCGDLGQTTQRLIDNRFEVRFHAEYPDLPPDTLICTAAVRPFEQIIPLPVYGLDAGSYEYSVNGDFTGTFTLTKDNRL